jgi:hypothetical protein
VWAVLRVATPDDEKDVDDNAQELLDAYADGEDLTPRADGRRPEACSLDLAAAA